MLLSKLDALITRLEFHYVGGDDVTATLVDICEVSSRSSEDSTQRFRCEPTWLGKVIKAVH